MIIFGYYMGSNNSLLTVSILKAIFWSEARQNWLCIFSTTWSRIRQFFQHWAAAALLMLMPSYQVRIQDLVKGGPQLLRPTVADVAKRSRASEASILPPGSRAHLRALEAFGFLMLKYAFSHILDTLFLLFLTSILTPKVDKNRALDFTSINLRHSDMLHLFFNLHEKVML